MAKRPRAAGFTLTEILVAVAIVGILAAIAVLQYQSHALRARVAGALEFASESRTRVALDLAQDKNLKTDLLNNGGKPVNDITSLVWYPGKSGEPVAGHILATMQLPGQGTRNVFALELKQGVWQCVNAAKYADPDTALDNDYLPAACREGAAPIATASNAPAGAPLDVTSACVGGDPAAFKSKASGDGKPQSCASGTSALGAAAGTNRTGSTGSTSSANAGSTTGSESSSGNSQSVDTGVDGKGGSTATAVAPDKATGGAGSAAAAADTQGTGATSSGDGTRGQSPGNAPGAKGGSPATGATASPAIATILCGQSFEAVQNVCTLAGSPAPRVCRSEKEDCERVHVTGRDCPAAQPFAANVVENLSDGSRYVTRRCVSLGEAFQGVKKNRETAACTSYDTDKPVYARFTCVFPCYGVDCNRSLVPDNPATRLTWENDIVEAGSGRKRTKTGADLPDLFDTWNCPRGTLPDKTTVGRCVRDTAPAATADSKAPAGAKPGK